VNKSIQTTENPHEYNNHQAYIKKHDDFKTAADDTQTATASQIPDVVTIRVTEQLDPLLSAIHGKDAECKLSSPPLLHIPPLPPPLYTFSSFLVPPP